jgi:hypothetical protein
VKQFLVAKNKLKFHTLKLAALVRVLAQNLERDPAPVELVAGLGK